MKAKAGEVTAGQDNQITQNLMGVVTIAHVLSERSMENSEQCSNIPWGVRRTTPAAAWEVDTVRENTDKVRAVEIFQVGNDYTWTTVK